MHINSGEKMSLMVTGNFDTHVYISMWKFKDPVTIKYLYVNF